MTKFKKLIWSKFIKAIREFDMVEDGDRIAVGVSGGKDSLLLANLFQRLTKDKSRNFEFVPITLDPGFSHCARTSIEDNLKKLELNYHMHDTNIWDVAFKKDPKNPCFLCAKMRRGVLYKKAEELGCNKLALGHHFDDVIETSLINMFYAGSLKTMLPKVKSSSGNFDLIRPLVYVKEEDIIKFIESSDLEPMKCGCDFEIFRKDDSKRLEIKNLLADLEKKNPNIKKSIFSSMRNINLKYVMGYTE